MEFIKIKRNKYVNPDMIKSVEINGDRVPDDMWVDDYKDYMFDMIIRYKDGGADKILFDKGIFEKITGVSKYESEIMSDYYNSIH